MTQASEFTHLFMHVTDLKRSKEFYSTLGFAVLMDHGGYVRIGSRDGFYIGMEQRPSDQVGAAGIEIVIRVPDVDAAYHRLVASGVKFDTPPADQEWGAKHAWLRDPDGYRLSIYSRP